MELIEILWDLLSSLINEFMFELNNGLLNLLMHGMAVRQTKRYGRHRSLVRWIGTVLPLRPCRRTYSSIFYTENQYGACAPYAFTANNPHCEGPGDFETWSRDLKNNAPDVVSSIKFSTPKEGILGKNLNSGVTVEKFAALEEQVLQLQEEISKILSAQLLNPLKVDHSGNWKSNTKFRTYDSNKEDRHNGMKIGVDVEESPRRNSTPSLTTTQEPSAPPPPPPPPPPMPSFSLPSKPLIRSKSLNDHISQHSKIHLNNEGHKHYSSTMPPNMSAVLKDLGTVKLRHVERSPGGTPVRRRPLTPPRNDPAALLAAALRRRYAHMRPDESSPDCTQMTDGSPQKSFEIVDQSPYSLSPQAINNLGTLKI